MLDLGYWEGSGMSTLWWLFLGFAPPPTPWIHLHPIERSAVVIVRALALLSLHVSQSGGTLSYCPFAMDHHALYHHEKGPSTFFG
jgi:hypothetical protein